MLQDEIAAMVNDLTGLTTDMATQKSTVTEDAPADESATIEGLVRKAEELQKRRADLQAKQRRAAKLFEEERAQLVEELQASSRALLDAKDPLLPLEADRLKAKHMLKRKGTQSTHSAHDALVVSLQFQLCERTSIRSLSGLGGLSGVTFHELSRAVTPAFLRAADVATKKILGLTTSADDEDFRKAWVTFIAIGQN
eukprot:Skav211072  [mRNA]  locus=scaffold314:266692:274841:- [translate_table: standard]